LEFISRRKQFVVCPHFFMFKQETRAGIAPLAAVTGALVGGIFVL
jgi:hypothetical protein